MRTLTSVGSSHGMIEIRNCAPGDYAGVVDIYNHYVENSHATFDISPYSVGERVPWFAQFAETGPHQLLVATRDAGVAGWCCSAPFGTRPGYDVSVETTIYVAPDACGQGIGSSLYGQLLSRLEATGLHGAYAGVALPNDSSVRLHERAGFRKIGVYAEVGRKFERFIDVAWFERRL